MDSKVRVKCLGGRELEGTLKGYDDLVNLVLDDTDEYMRGKFLSLCVCVCCNEKTESCVLLGVTTHRCGYCMSRSTRLATSNQQDTKTRFGGCAWNPGFVGISTRRHGGDCQSLCATRTRGRMSIKRERERKRDEKKPRQCYACVKRTQNKVTGEQQLPYFCYGYCATLDRWGLGLFGLACRDLDKILSVSL